MTYEATKRLIELQHRNRQMRWLYVGFGLALVAAGAILGPLPIIVGLIFIGLAVWNERLIRRCDRALREHGGIR